ncbi:MAG: T9SS type A sorting domain-containing protein, partial [Bacteroidetes bacterium]|nr:T9SS type A sorting domain-containing protein [Bacteroidota bacterium]
TQTSGPNTAGITAAGSASTGISGLIAGTYIFQLTVTDNHGLTDNSSVTITVLPANTAPIANAGSNQTIQLPASSVTLNGSGTGTNGATISSYAWTQTNGPATATISTASGASTGVTGLVQGTYVFTLTVTDNHGLINSASVTITVLAANTAPIANAGSNQTIQLPTNTTTLNGGGTGTNGATISSYAWSQDSGPATAGFTAANAASTDVTGLVQGTYVFRLTVTDNHGLSSSATVTITVLPLPNTAPVANAGSDQTIQLPVNSVILNGSGTGTNGATISSYAWTQTSGPAAATITSPATAGTAVTGLVQGLYVFTLTVTDNHGLTDQASVIIVVNPAFTAPIANAGNDQTITLPANSVILSGSGTGTGGATISSYAWVQTSGPNTATISNSSAASPNVSGLVQGTYVFTLTVTDNHGLTGSATVNITVLPVPNVAPVANAGSDAAITLPVSSVTLDGSASYDPDGSIVKYSWNKISGAGAITILYSNTTKPTVIGLLQAGTYIFELTVTDDKGATATDQVQITVNPSNNKSPVADAGRDTTVALPYSGAILNGKSSYDPDGRIVSYVWSQVSGPTLATIAYPLDSLSAVTGLQEGQYVFLLTVMDNEGFIATDSMKVTVVNAYRYTQYFRIYPNPVTTTLHLEYIDDHTGKVKVTILDESGKMVLQQEMSKDQSLLNRQIDVSVLKSGMYFIQIDQAGTGKLVRPFVKQ